jgi:hypothetical protein
VPKKKVRKKKEEVEKTEDKQTENKPKKKTFHQYDGKLLFAANQLAIKLFHLNPKKEPEKVMLKTKKLLEDIWRCSRRYIRATERAAEWGKPWGCPAPLDKRGFAFFETRHRAGAPAEAGNFRL